MIRTISGNGLGNGVNPNLIPGIAGEFCFAVIAIIPPRPKIFPKNSISPSDDKQYILSRSSVSHTNR